MATGLEPLILKAAMPLAAKGLHELTKPATQDKLVKAIKPYPGVPKLSWRQRSRLKAVIGSVDAGNALLDQDPPAAKALSAMVADKVFGEVESDRSLATANALITVYPKCVDGGQNAVLAAYQLRLVRQALDVHGEHLADISQAVTDVHALVAPRGSARIDPQVLLSGPLEGLGLQSAYQQVLQHREEDPAGASERLSDIIERIEKDNHVQLARRLRAERADLLARAGQLAEAADAWLPMVEDYLTGYGYGPHDAVNAWEVISAEEGAPVWLQARRSAVTALEHCYLGDTAASNALQAAVAAADAADPAAFRWVLHAAEACLVDHQPNAVAGQREQMLSAAAASTDPMVGVRLKLVVADATGDEELWLRLLDAAVAGTPGWSAQRAALIHARRGRNLFWNGQLEQALAQYRMAAAHGTQARNYQDAAAWFESARHVLSQAESIPYDDLTVLSQRVIALHEAGPGSLLKQGDDPRTTALAKLVDVNAENGQARSTRIDLRRYLRRSVILGELTDELDAHRHLGRLYLRMGRPESAVLHFITAGEVSDAGAAAATLTTYYDCLSAAQSPLPGPRAAALHTAFRQADLIPDDLAATWARIGLDEAKRHAVPPLSADTCLHGYEVLQGLANRFPDTLVDEFLQEIDPLLPRSHGYRIMDEHVAHILVGLGRSNPSHIRPVAERIATVFEQADDLASIVVDAARSLSQPLKLIRPRLEALLPATPDRRLAQRLHAALALVEIGETSSALTTIADNAVTIQLDTIPAHAGRRAGSAEETAILAGCLPIDRRAVLARHYCARILDADDTELNRAMYTSACRIVAADLPDEIRNELFDELFPLHTPTESRHPSDVVQRSMNDPFGFLRVRTRPGRLRRQVVKTLAVLASDEARQERAWRAAQPLAVSGDRYDANTVGNVGYSLAAKGFAAQLPWDAMASSSDAEMRRLAAALIPLTPDVDIEAVTSLASDTNWAVRRDLAQAITKITRASAAASKQFQGAIDLLRSDASYRVRSALIRT